MAYRHKGFLTLKQRSSLLQLVHNYRSLAASPDTPFTPELVEATIKPWSDWSRWLLSLDTSVMIKRAIGKAIQG